MRIQIKGDADRGMAQHFRDHLGMDTLQEQESGGSMAQVIKTNRWEAWQMESPPW
jgi:hypothetical protein